MEHVDTIADNNNNRTPEVAYEVIFDTNRNEKDNEMRGNSQEIRGIFYSDSPYSSPLALTDTNNATNAAYSTSLMNDELLSIPDEINFEQNLDLESENRNMDSNENSLAADDHMTSTPLSSSVVSGQNEIRSLLANPEESVSQSGNNQLMLDQGSQSIPTDSNKRPRSDDNNDDNDVNGSFRSELDESHKGKKKRASKMKGNKKRCKCKTPSKTIVVNDNCSINICNPCEKATFVCPNPKKPMEKKASSLKHGADRVPIGKIIQSGKYGDLFSVHTFQNVFKMLDLPESVKKETFEEKILRCKDIIPFTINDVNKIKITYESGP